MPAALPMLTSSDAAPGAMAEHASTLVDAADADFVAGPTEADAAAPPSPHSMNSAATLVQEQQPYRQSRSCLRWQGISVFEGGSGTVLFHECTGFGNA